MDVDFAFGRTGLRVALPDGPRYQLLENRSASPLADPVAAIEHALDHCIAGPSLAELARGKHTAAISVCDITRPVPNFTTLPPLLRRLHDSEIPIDGVTILIATGLHRPATPEEIRQIVGPDIASRYRVVNHDARDAAAHRSLGHTPSGIPVFIDARFLDADLHITLGFIEQHLMLGFSGGRKLIAPGLAGEETIKTIHSPRFMREPLATEGSYARNPLHAELLTIAAMARHDFLVDVTLTPTRAISGVFAGSPVAAHRAGVAFLEQTSLETIPARADLVITSAAGHPLDLTFYQTIKGVTAAQHLVKPGGTILILGSCAEGVGSPEFAGKLRSFGGYQPFLDEIDGQAVVADQWQLEKLALVGLENELLFYTPGVKPHQAGALAPRLCASPDEAVRRALSGLPEDAAVAVIPEGPYVFARAAV